MLLTVPQDPLPHHIAAVLLAAAPCIETNTLLSHNNQMTRQGRKHTNLAKGNRRWTACSPQALGSWPSAVAALSRTLCCGWDRSGTQAAYNSSTTCKFAVIYNYTSVNNAVRARHMQGQTICAHHGGKLTGMEQCGIASNRRPQAVSAA